MKIKQLNGRFKQIIALGNTKGNGAFRKQFVVKLIISVEVQVQRDSYPA